MATRNRSNRGQKRDAQGQFTSSNRSAGRSSGGSSSGSSSRSGQRSSR